MSWLLLDDCSGRRATVLSVHETQDQARAASRRGGRGTTEVAEIDSALGEPTKGERVWYVRGAGVVTGRGAVAS